MNGNGKQTRFVIGLVIALIVVIFAVLNVNPVTVSFGFTRVKLPLIILIIVFSDQNQCPIRRIIFIWLALIFSLLLTSFLFS